MRNADLADTPLAAHRPPIEAEADTLRDFLRETFARFKGNLPLTRIAFQALSFQLIDEAISEAGAAELLSAPAASSPAADIRELTVGILRIISRSDEGGFGMRAACFLRLLGEDGRSFQQLADDYGFTSRAAPHAAYRAIQKRTGLRARGDKSDRSREACRRRRTGQRRVHQPWSGKSAWSKALSSLPAAA